MIDHSLTYRKKTLRNIPHILRLRKILRIVKKMSPSKGDPYADIGCSNGYITNILHEKFSLGPATGFDHTMDNILLARERYTKINFEFIDLNTPIANEIGQYKILTCFETLEHVGSLRQAVQNILTMGMPGSKVLMSVPIETGLVGILKFLVKSFILKYSLEELPERPSKMTYFSDLVKGTRMSKFRDSRSGWGTHFGFDYRDVDDILNDLGIAYKAFNSFSTRFYIINL